MNRIAVDLHFLPTLEFFAAIAEAEEVLLFPKDFYPRQSYFNRTRIRLANKVETLSVPIQGRRPKLPIDQIKIDFTQNWQAVHLRGIQSGYGKAPFFEYYFPYFQDIYQEGAENLWEFNFKLLTICLKLLRWPARLAAFEGIEIPADVQNIRGQIVPSEPYSVRNYYHPVSYTQLFGLDFEPNLGILDLLFCAGPESDRILRDSIKKH
ncbi:WbqC family protein [Algoriphagus litoralis]|uniref:WbqC family protein n=1 Tax=Algoriphagus litoralis TaxID=2202829 RepID=UPI000DBA55DD|nr:WbqC family protein [Algoriphagus litoralis]